MPPSCPLCGLQPLNVKHLVESCRVTINSRMGHGMDGKTLEKNVNEGLHKQLTNYIEDINFIMKSNAM